MTTLADMAPEQRDQCRGMWADVTHSILEPRKAIVLRIASEWGDETCAIVIDPVNGEQPAGHDRVTPRFDLPRAWNPEGTPPKGEWEEEFTDSEGYTLSTIEELPGVGPHEAVRRWIGEWEATE